MVLSLVAVCSSARWSAADGTVATQAAAAVTLGQDLITNGGAEDSIIAVVDGGAGDIPGWTRVGDIRVRRYANKPGRWPTTTDPGPVERGGCFFNGGRHIPVDSLNQVVDLTSLGATVDSGAVSFALAAYLGGSGDSDDNAAVQARFLDASGALLGTAVIGPVLAADRGNETGLWLRSSTGALPVGARTASVTVVFTGTEKNNCLGLADSIGLSLSRTSTADVEWPAGTTGLHLLIAPDPVVVDACVAFTLPTAGPARLEVLDVSGRRVAVLADDVRPAGQYRLRWAPRPSGAAAGVYFVRLATASGAVTRKVVALGR